MQVLTGLRLIEDGPPDSPVRMAYAISIPKREYDKNGRRSWDQTAVLAAIRGIDPCFTLKKVKFITYSDGRNGWIDDPNGSHKYLVLEMNPDSVAYEIESLMIHEP